MLPLLPAPFDGSPKLLAMLLAMLLPYAANAPGHMPHIAMGAMALPNIGMPQPPPAMAALPNIDIPVGRVGHMPPHMPIGMAMPCGSELRPQALLSFSESESEVGAGSAGSAVAVAEASAEGAAAEGAAADGAAADSAAAFTETCTHSSCMSACVYTKLGVYTLERWVCIHKAECVYTESGTHLPLVFEHEERSND